MLTPEIIQKLKADHGSELYRKSAAGETVVIKPPNRGVYEQYKAEVADVSKRPAATERLVRQSIVWPEPSIVADMFERKAGLIETFAGEALDLIGFAVKVESEKL
jgi:hypothetical protein